MDQEQTTQTRVAAISIIIENPDSVEEVNRILHEGRGYILGRMGIPYREKNLNIITIVLDAPQSVTSGMSGKIGKLPGVSVKTAYSGSFQQ